MTSEMHFCSCNALQIPTESKAKSHRVPFSHVPMAMTYLAVHLPMPKDPVNVVAIPNALLGRLSLKICLFGLPPGPHVS